MWLNKLSLELSLTAICNVMLSNSEQPSRLQSADMKLMMHNLSLAAAVCAAMRMQEEPHDAEEEEEPAAVDFLIDDDDVVQVFLLLLFWGWIPFILCSFYAA